MGLFRKKEKLRDDVRLELVAVRGNVRFTLRSSSLVDKLSNKEIKYINSLFTNEFPPQDKVEEKIDEMPATPQQSIPPTIGPQDEKFFRDMIERIERDEDMINKAMEALKKDNIGNPAAARADELIEMIRKSAENTKLPEKNDIFADKN